MMPDFEAAASIIREEFNKKFRVQYPDYGRVFENVAFTPSDNTPWVRLTLREGEANLSAFGGGKNNYRHPGNVQAQVFVPVGTGDGLAREIADFIASIFRGKRLSSIRFFNAPYINTIGPDGDWFQVNVICPFEYDLQV
jgi:hypothetical protein